MGKSYHKSGENDNALGQIIRTQMRKLNLSREELAKRLDVSPARVSQLFQYEHSMRFDTLQRLASALRVSVDKLGRAASKGNPRKHK